MRPILHADDFGQSEDSYSATVDCFERGVLTSASIMPLMPASDAAIQYARAHPEYSFGAHLTFARNTVEKPVSNPSKIPHLLDSDGNFTDYKTIRIRTLCHQIPPEEIECEVKAQLRYFRDHGVAAAFFETFNSTSCSNVLGWILCNMEKRKIMGERVRDRAGDFSWQSHAASLLDIFQSMRPSRVSAKEYQ
jgi:predicted glycoside hydrolase/deacetylase ChbG (UPF0249 family)